MKKVALISLCILTALSAFADSPNTATASINLEQEKQNWELAQHQAYLKRLKQREIFWQVERMLKSAVKNQQFSEATQNITKNLIDSLQDYPLQYDLLTRFWETKIAFLQNDDIQGKQQALDELNTLVQQNYPFVTPAFQALLQKLSTLNEQQTSATSANAKENNRVQKEQNQIENPKQLAEIVRKSDPNTLDKTVLIDAFPRYLKTLSEQMNNPSFESYQQWADIWQLSEDEIKQWKIAFLNRFFDNKNADFQKWRDEQILQLRVDNLTERRLRMAIWQKTELTSWLNLLSAESKSKQEWRYWEAKQDISKNTKKLTALSKERGFYPMLAATQLKQAYKVDFPVAPSFTVAEQLPFEQVFAMIRELRELGRNGLAKQRWRILLGDVDFTTQLKLAQYADNQQWFELAVDASIVAKAWDYLSLRLPNAYSEYFNATLQNLNISKTFAMAIARQESAWNPMAQSSANARGLMQLLPSTAKLTAENNQLPYQGEQDLFKPLNNISLGTAHLNELNEKYPNNRILIAAAYNAGASRVEKWLSRANGELALDEFVASIPFYETRGYVQNVVAYDFYYQILQNKENPQIFSQEELNRLY
ncbi:lytic murein transglycosylase [Haemophilus influenzae biotype aegyptius]|uniref:transglycosylase SLT domain-containing protein n=1 Tax=Haemophilus influenzae TaxID=727 RepID=UPI0001F36CF6|nr:transglycosylase SLT domain-containing protein [Haemophilus influenzae]QEQ62528.1 transglycosylase SLT domain-containing protein [Haemophilus influenzae biotype aegyptius]QEQ63757.1 transglycosylase SLT domain-containing protein [Haemophilus influenzae biotype aegyptius]QEQ66094.1 transglycosylase SLT domain-containing protein [Haemophilus influenzae biotype aegyptius]TMQ39975.1 lytic murein transglycosylase [Haemophilus influenzae biotype aegyptius]TMQ40475.1 lytic murein transglycosylase 